MTAIPPGGPEVLIAAQATTPGSLGQVIVPLAGLAVIVLIVAAGIWLGNHRPALVDRGRRRVAAAVKPLAGLRDRLARENHPVIAAGIALMAALAGAVIVIYAVGLFTKLGAVVHLDRPFDLYVDRHRVTSLTHLMLAVTLLGSYPVVFTIAVTGGIVIGVLTRRWLPLLVLVGSILAEKLIQRVIISLVHGPTPAQAMAVGPPGPYFSGGTARTIIVCGLLVYFLGWLGLQRRQRAMLWAGVALIAFLECFSRLYLGRHFAVDIAGGWVAGITILAAFAFAAGALRWEAGPTPSPGPDPASAAPPVAETGSHRAPDRQGSHA
jgi:membrane-associated phospholipid phosphatase